MYERAVLLEMRELLTREKSCTVFYDSSVGSYVDVSRGQGGGYMFETFTDDVSV